MNFSELSPLERARKYRQEAEDARRQAPGSGPTVHESYRILAAHWERLADKAAKQVARRSFMGGEDHEPMAKGLDGGRKAKGGPKVARCALRNGGQTHERSAVSAVTAAVGATTAAADAAMITTA